MAPVAPIYSYAAVSLSNVVATGCQYEVRTRKGEGGRGRGGGRGGGKEERGYRAEKEQDEYLSAVMRSIARGVTGGQWMDKKGLL